MGRRARHKTLRKLLDQINKIKKQKTHRRMAGYKRWRNSTIALFRDYPEIPESVREILMSMVEENRQEQIQEPIMYTDHYHGRVTGVCLLIISTKRLIREDREAQLLLLGFRERVFKKEDERKDREFVYEF